MEKLRIWSHVVLFSRKYPIHTQFLCFITSQHTRLAVISQTVTSIFHHNSTNTWLTPCYPLLEQMTDRRSSSQSSLILPRHRSMVGPPLCVEIQNECLFSCKGGRGGNKPRGWIDYSFSLSGTEDLVTHFLASLARLALIDHTSLLQTSFITSYHYSPHSLFSCTSTTES